MANALDSGATRITFECDPALSTLIAVDNGCGMQRRELARYHDIAASTKTRGQGIGFAGVGIKLGLLVCSEVFTETRREKSHVATSWHMASRHRAPWKWVPPAGLVAERGTAVRLKFRIPYPLCSTPDFWKVLCAVILNLCSIQVSTSFLPDTIPRASQSMSMASS